MQQKVLVIWLSWLLSVLSSTPHFLEQRLHLLKEKAWPAIVWHPEITDSSEHIDMTPRASRWEFMSEYAGAWFEQCEHCQKQKEVSYGELCKYLKINSTGPKWGIASTYVQGQELSHWTLAELYACTKATVTLPRKHCRKEICPATACLTLDRCHHCYWSSLPRVIASKQLM